MVLIAPKEAVDTLRGQLPEDNSLQVFTEFQVREAVEYIATEKPAVVAIEERFAVSPRGEALVGRIMDDPTLAGCEIRILTGAPRVDKASRRKSGTGIKPAVAVAPPELVEVPPTPQGDRWARRRIDRVRLIAGISVTVDGNPAELIDLTHVGAQVVSRMVLRPNQRVRVQLPEDKNDGRRAVRCSASVVWASFEMPPGQPPRYRAGLKLSGAEAEVFADFALLHRADEK